MRNLVAKILVIAKTLVIAKILSGLHTSTRLAGAFDLRAHADGIRRMIDSITLA